MHLLTLIHKYSKCIISIMTALALTMPFNSDAINAFLLRPQTTPETKSTNSKSPASVNGKKITAKQLDEAVGLAISNGAESNSQLRQTWLTDLIAKELILQDVQKTNLSTQRGNELKIRLAAENTLVNLWFTRYLTNPSYCRGHDPIHIQS